jgi:hypothetical protein
MGRSDDLFFKIGSKCSFARLIDRGLAGIYRCVQRFPLLATTGLLTAVWQGFTVAASEHWRIFISFFA